MYEFERKNNEIYILAKKSGARKLYKKFEKQEPWIHHILHRQLACNCTWSI